MNGSERDEASLQNTGNINNEQGKTPWGDDKAILRRDSRFPFHANGTLSCFIQTLTFSAKVSVEVTVSVTLIRDASINQENTFSNGNVTSAYEPCLMVFAFHDF